MADIRGVYGRQAEAHQFPIQFAALALPILGTRLLREGGSSLPPERWHCLLDESFPRLNIEHSVTPPPFDRVCYGEKKREGGILRETSGVESFSYSRNVIFRWNLWERALYSGMKALFEF